MFVKQQAKVLELFDVDSPKIVECLDVTLKLSLEGVDRSVVDDFGLRDIIIK